MNEQNLHLTKPTYGVKIVPYINTSSLDYPLSIELDPNFNRITLTIVVFLTHTHVFTHKEVPLSDTLVDRYLLFY